MKHFEESELCVLDDLSPLQMEMLVFEKIMKMKEVHSHKFHKKRRNSIEVLPEGVVAENEQRNDVPIALNHVSLLKFNYEAI